MEMIITGRVIDAQEAYRIGLVSEVVPKGRSLERAIEPGNVIAALPQPAIRTDKEATVEDLGCRSLSDFGLKSNAFTGRLAVRLLTKDCVNLLNGIMQIGRQIEGHAPQDSSVVRESLRLRQMQSSSLWNSSSAN